MSNKFLPFRHEDTYIFVQDVLATLILEAIDYETRGLPDVDKLVEQENEFREMGILPNTGDLVYGWIPISADTLVSKYFQREGRDSILRKIKLLVDKDLLFKKPGVKSDSGGGRPPNVYRVNLRKYMDSIAEVSPGRVHNMWDKLGLKNGYTLSQDATKTLSQNKGTLSQNQGTLSQIATSHTIERSKEERRPPSPSFSSLPPGAVQKDKSQKTTPENDLVKIAFEKLSFTWGSKIWNPDTLRKFDRMVANNPEISDWIFMLKNLDASVKSQIIKKDLQSTLGAFKYNLVKSKSRIVEYFETEKSETKQRKKLEKESPENSNYALWKVKRNLQEINAKSQISKSYKGDIEFYLLNEGAGDSRALLLEIIDSTNLNVEDSFRESLYDGVKAELERSSNFRRFCKGNTVEYRKMLGVEPGYVEKLEKALFEWEDTVDRCIQIARSIPEPKNSYE